MNSASSPHESRFAAIERERRFLLDHLPEGIDLARAARIEDLYLHGTTLRLRRVQIAECAMVWKLTQKHSIDPAHSILTTIYLSAAEYDVLRALPGDTLDKLRIRHADDQHCAVNVFQGSLHGLILAEIEFASDEEMAGTAAPTFAAAEITEDEALTGRLLAGSRWALIRSHLLSMYGVTVFAV